MYARQVQVSGVCTRHLTVLSFTRPVSVLQHSPSNCDVNICCCTTYNLINNNLVYSSATCTKSEQSYSVFCNATLELRSPPFPHSLMQSYWQKYICTASTSSRLFVCQFVEIQFRPQHRLIQAACLVTIHHLTAVRLRPVPKSKAFFNCHG